MQAVILVGGEGTRLHPLTFDLPKPMVPICGRPFMEYQLELLGKFGVHEVIFSLGYKWKVFEEHFQEGSSWDMRLHYVVEESPLGTGGAIKNVEHLLDGKTFLVLNGDVLSPFDLGSIVDFHKNKGSKCTIALTPVDNPSLYGVVEMDEGQRILKFTEKPDPPNIPSNQINAGLYVMEPEILSFMEPDRVYSIERQIFPKMLDEKIPLYGFHHEGYWMDIGNPFKYLSANKDVLLGLVNGHMEKGREIIKGENVLISSKAKLLPPLWIGNGARIEDDASVIGPAVIGRGCIIGKGSTVREALLWDDAIVGESCLLDGCLVGRSSMIQDEARIGSLAVLGSGSLIEKGMMVEPGRKIEKFP